MNHLNPEQHKEILTQLFSDFETRMMEKVQESIKLTVNGKIDKLREDMKPTVAFFDEVRLGKKIIIAIIGFLASIGGLILIIQKIFK